MTAPIAGIVDYRFILKEGELLSSDELVALFLRKLPSLWRDAYLAMPLRQTDILRVQHNTFEYIYDCFPALQPDSVQASLPDVEPRLVGVLGRSAPRKAARDDYRLRGWVGPTEKSFGRTWDKGHYIAHSLGGAVDGAELNVFVQRRSLNRGWSEAGKRYRQMEKYCAANPGILCFSRPLYVDQSAKPAFVEFGVLKPKGDLWLECSDNR